MKWGKAYGEKDNNSDARLEVEKTEYGRERTRPQLLFKSEFHDKDESDMQ